MRTFITILVVAGVISPIATFMAGVGSKDGRLHDDPWQQKTELDGLIAQERKLGWSITELQAAASSSATITFRLLDSMNQPLETDSVRLRINRTSTLEYDAEHVAVPVGNGYLEATDINMPLPGWWNLVLEVQSGEDRLVLRRRIRIAGESQ